MKKLIFPLLLCPFLSMAQEPKPEYKNDTLYATCGYKIYRGQTLQFGKGSGRNGKFRYINIKNSVPYASLANNTIVVTDLLNFGISSLDNAYIEIIGTIVFKDGSKGTVDIHMAFDLAIENSPGLTSELVVPDEFRNNSRVYLKNDLNKLFSLYRNGKIKKKEYEERKKKLLEQPQ